MVMFTELRDRPLIRLVRESPVWLIPGNRVVNSSALRDTGSSITCFTSIVVVTVALCVWRISPPASTVTESDTSPTCSVTRTVAGVPASIFTFGTTPVLKPGRLTDTVYVPGVKAGITNVPFSIVKVSNFALVASLTTLTTAPGINAPDGSETEPDNGAVELICATACPTTNVITAMQT